MMGLAMISPIPPATSPLVTMLDMAKEPTNTITATNKLNLNKNVPYVA
jgi:hypothetical protein